MRNTIHPASSPGLVWDGWKQKNRKAMIYVESRLHRDRSREIRKARELVQCAEDEFVSTRSSESSWKLERVRVVLEF